MLGIPSRRLGKVQDRKSWRDVLSKLRSGGLVVVVNGEKDVPIGEERERSQLVADKVLVVMA